MTLPAEGPGGPDGLGAGQAGAHDHERTDPLGGGRVDAHAPTVVSRSVTEERRDGATLRLVGAALVGAAVLAVTVGAALACLVLAATCAVAAVVRGVLHGHRPAGLAVRSTVTDVGVLTLLAVSLAVLSLSPGV